MNRSIPLTLNGDDLIILPEGGRSTSSYSEGTYQSSEADFITSFFAILRRWESETVLESNPDRIMKHPSFRALVDHADIAFSLIIDQLLLKPSHLVWVLEEAYHERPYSIKDAGNLSKMADAWIEWAERNGRIS